MPPANGTAIAATGLRFSLQVAGKGPAPFAVLAVTAPGQGGTSYLAVRAGERPIWIDENDVGGVAFQ